MKAYLDIETTFDGEISVVGIYVPGRGLVQLTGGDVTDVAITDALEGVSSVVTFNGSSFDLPFIRRVAGVDIRDLAEHVDLMRVCRKRGLRGGLKRIEVLLGISRSSGVTDGREAPRLWQRFVNDDDRSALEKLLLYNREDVVNLELLEEILGDGE